MTDFVLQSVHDGLSLTLSPLQGRACHVALRGSDVNATVTVLDVTGEGVTSEGVTFSGFWRDLAAHWQGWSGVKTWRSFEGVFELEARSDALGHIQVACSLSCNQPDEWRVKAWLFTEAGTLEALAARALSFDRAVRSD